MITIYTNQQVAYRVHMHTALKFEVVKGRPETKYTQIS